MKPLRKFFFALAYLMPAILFFSYYPLISLGNDATMNFELSLPLIWLVLFDVAGFILLIDLWRHRKDAKELPGLSDKRFFLFSLFPFYATLSAFWSPNPTRAILTAGVLWCTFFAVFALLFIFPLLRPSPRWRQFFLRSIFISTALVCVFCWVQCLLDLAGLSRSSTLLCAGCTFWTFGFPHPSGFAIEPQFMGNLLLAPTLLAIFLLSFKQKISPQSRLRRGLLLAAAILFSATLFLTLSRGAIYAYAIALFVLFIFALAHNHLARRTATPRTTSRTTTLRISATRSASASPATSTPPAVKWRYIIIIPVVTFLITLAAQGIFSALSPTPDTFHSGVAKVIHQLSLGLIDIRPSQLTSSSQTATSPTSETPNPSPEPSVTNSSTPDDNQSIFDGYIPASTNVRLGLNGLALRTWLLRPTSILFGVGLGGAGLALNGAFPEHELALPNAIVQNEPCSLLLELGLVGILLVIFTLLLAFFAPIFPRRFLDGRSAPKNTKASAPAKSLQPLPAPAKSSQSAPVANLRTIQKSPQSLKSRLRTSIFWSHPALPLLLALLAAYFVTLQFFSGLPNALQIYLMPPLLFLLFAKDPHHLVDD